ncbi:MAG TPA: orotidine-5'-phosphate decarboxylase [Planctomycetota bacterium]|nr:orotidine-5'-phosphate decarboxylase [Planctomycetota bacterium]
MKNFADRLVDAIKTKKSRVVVGLDPRLESLPEDFRHGVAKDIERAGRAVLDFNAALIDLVKDHAVAVKPQIAFYEKLGPYGVVAYFATCKHARDNGLLVIGDVKRGDVPDTAKAYSDAHFYAFPADAITVNPFFGSDGMDPFVQGAQKVGGGLFVLVKTSNPSSGEIQDLNVDGRPLYMHLAQKVGIWGAPLMGESGYSAIGAVVGATHPKQAAEIRAALPKAFFLVPGYGAQGGKAEDLKACFNPDGLGAVVNSSRGIISAWERDAYKGMSWEKAVAKAVLDMKADINAAIGV